MWSRSQTYSTTYAAAPAAQTVIGVSLTVWLLWRTKSENEAVYAIAGGSGGGMRMVDASHFVTERLVVVGLERSVEEWKLRRVM